MNFKRLTIIVLAIFIVSACNDDSYYYTNDNTDNNRQEEIGTSEDIQSLSSQLFGTSWKFYKLVEKDGYTHYSWPIDCVITFSNESAREDRYYLKIDGKCYSNAFWWIDNNGLTYFLSVAGYDLGLSSYDVGAWAASGGYAGDAQIIKKTSSELVIKHVYSDAIDTIYFKSASSSGDNGSSYEAPEIGFYDFTASKTTLKVQYRIYDGEVTNATIYYGPSYPSRSASTSITGNMIIANISGLKSGTEYYVKCIASGPGGSTTSNTTKCITNY